jgi:hypothetical protein
MKIIVGTLVAAAVVGAAHPALAQDAEPWGAAVQRIVDDSRAQGLPVNGLYERAKLGAVLRKSPSEVTSAVREHARRLAVARAALQPSPVTIDIEAGAFALANKVSESSLRQIRAARTDRPIAVPLGVLTQLVVAGLPMSRATGVVLDAVRKGAGDAQFLAFQDEIMRDLERGIRIESAFDLRAKRLAATLPLVPGSAATADVAAPAQGLGTANSPRANGPAGTTKPGGKPPRP